MELSSDDRTALNLALEEAILIDVDVDREGRWAAVTLEVLTLPIEGPGPEDPRVVLLLEPVGRIAASLRIGPQDDDSAAIQPFLIDELTLIVGSFSNRIYGGDYFGDGKETTPNFVRKNRLSLDLEFGIDGHTHSLYLVRDTLADRCLEVCLWFDRFTIQDFAGRFISLADFMAGGQRWWDAFSQNDPRTHGRGIINPKFGG